MTQVNLAVAGLECFPLSNIDACFMVYSMMISGLAWFILLFSGGLLLLLLSRAKNQSWIDGDSHKDPESSARNKKLIIE